MLKASSLKTSKRFVPFALAFVMCFSCVATMMVTPAKAISANLATYYDSDFDWCSTPEYEAFSVDVTYIAFAATCEPDSNGNPQTDDLVICIDQVYALGNHQYTIPFTADGVVRSVPINLSPGIYTVYVTGSNGIVKDYCRLLFSTTV